MKHSCSKNSNLRVLVLEDLIFGVMVFGVLVFQVLVFGVLVFRVLVFGVLVFEVLSFGGFWGSGLREPGLRSRVHILDCVFQ